MFGFDDLNLKFPLILAISVFRSSLNFMFSRVEHDKCFIISGPVENMLVLIGMPEQVSIQHLWWELFRIA